MAKKTYSGADLKAFYKAPDVWGTDAANPLYYVDDDIYLIDGEELDYEQSVEKYGTDFTKLSDSSKVSISSGVLVWQGDGSRKDHLDLAHRRRQGCRRPRLLEPHRSILTGQVSGQIHAHIVAGKARSAAGG